MSKVTEVDLPAPEVSDATRPFWRAASEGRLEMQKCTSCGHIRFPVGPVCTQCLSDAAEWTPLSGRGSILSHLVFHQPYSPAWKEQVPYSVVFVQLVEGPRMFSNLHDPEKQYVDRDLVGEEVNVWFDNVAPDIAVPRFKLRSTG